MSYDTNYIYGAYAKCVSKMQEKKEVGKACDLGHKVLDENMVYCSTCGNKLRTDVLKSLEKEAVVSPFDVMEQIDETLHCVYEEDNEFYFTPNIGTEHETQADFDDQEDGVYDLGDKEEYIRNFKKDFKKEIKVLKKHYESVEIDCGLIIYTS